MSPHDLHALNRSGRPFDLIDVRTPGEFAAVHVPFARNIPLGDLTADSVTQTGIPIYVICQSGGRGQKACAILPDAINIDGGTSAWVAAGLPVVRGPKSMSLERQVRIAAGTLVVLGISLAYFVHPGFAGLSAFVGCGLVFAGLTDTCGMGAVLARMPWNRAPRTDTISACR
jgi:rhodanese-related sulfurtransferase